jgi:hypothetical protein
MTGAYTIYINFIILLKLIFVCLAITHLYLKIKHRTDSDLDKQIIYYKERAEIIFVALMSGLLIFLFNPIIDNRTNFLNKETKLILYLFGIVLLITANWGIFFEESEYFKRIQSIV